MIITSATIYEKESAKLDMILKKIHTTPPETTQDFILYNALEEQYQKSNILTYSTQYLEELQSIASSNLLILLKEAPQYTDIVKEMISSNVLHDSEKEYLLSGDPQFLYDLTEQSSQIAETSQKIPPLGSVSALFESGTNGSQTIGYDPVGGTSYGTYQLSSLMGSVDRFIEFLNKHAPNIAYELSKHSTANTGDKEGALPETWKMIAAKEKDLFRKLENDFVIEQYYDPIVRKVKNLIPLTPAINEMLFSTAIQHGVSGANAIIRKALENTPNTFQEENFIREVYSVRQDNFSSSPLHVQQAITSRLENEANLIISYIS